jgi:hypothetical protein
VRFKEIIQISFLNWIRIVDTLLNCEDFRSILGRVHNAYREQSWLFLENHLNQHSAVCTAAQNFNLFIYIFRNYHFLYLENN